MTNEQAMVYAISKLEKLWIEKNDEVLDWHINRSKQNSKPLDNVQSRHFGRMVGELKAYTKACSIFLKLSIDLNDKRRSRINKAIRELSELDKPTTKEQ